MIEKNLFFIWIGTNKPLYIDYVIDTFKKVNPNFNVRLIHEPNFNDPVDNDVKEFKNEIYEKLYNNTYNKLDIYNVLYNRYYTQKYLKNYELIKFCDCFRFYLINKYGGIYLDCDTFPVKPFDDELLNNDSLFLNYFDIYFFAYKKNYLEYNPISKATSPEYHIMKAIKNNIIYCMPKDNYYKTIKDDFYNNFLEGKLKYGDKRYDTDNKYYYFDHYRVKTYLKKS